MKSVMHHSFAQVPNVQVPRSTFNRSSGYKATIDAGYLYPIFVDEVLPGDTFNLKESIFARLNTPLKPFMDNVYLDTHYFFVPYRLVWSNWEKFMGAQDNPDDTTDYLIPQVAAPTTTGFVANSLYDYMGIPTEVDGFSVNNLAARAYNLIWNEWFRDQNLQDSKVVDLDDGPDTITDYVLLKRGKRRDYFTSCLPFPQKGPAVELPLGTSADIHSTVTRSVDPISFYNTETAAWDKFATTGSSTALYAASGGVEANKLFADLSTATAATINQLREAFQVQRLYERDARGGTRYVELLKSHFGVTSPDYRLQRPELLGVGSTRVNVNPVAQTSESGTTPQGNLSAFGTASMVNKGFVKSFVEHGIIIGLASVRADLTYQQGVDRMWSRRTRFDLYWPSLHNIGEQAVLNKEIYVTGTATDDEVFGYQERYGEYKFKNSVITSQFRSNFATSLDEWHLSQDFGSLPVLNDSFIQENPPMDRVVAVTTAPDFILDAYFMNICARPMPTYSVPGLIDHF